MSCQNPIKAIDRAVFNGIRKTINRFRENPFLYFTESDIHASLSKDIMAGNSHLLIKRIKTNNTSNIEFAVSLLHHEYPTNFRYKSDDLKNECNIAYNLKPTKLTEKYGDRGNFDLVILNNNFICSIFNKYGFNFEEAMKHVINKDNTKAIERQTQEEVLYAIEVKYIHLFNAGNTSMETEVKKDNNKLHMALQASNYKMKPINLVFCSSNYAQRQGKPNENSIIKNIKTYLEKHSHEGVCSIFIQSYFDKKKKRKATDKPIIYFNPIGDNNWIVELRNMLKL